MAEESSSWVWFESSRPPVRGRGLTGRPEERRADERPVADVRVGDAAGGGNQRRGELGHLVDDDLRSPRVDDGFKVIGSRHELEVGEDLGQEEAALRVADELLEAWELRCPLGPEPFVGTSMECIEPGVARSTRVGLSVANATTCPALLASTARGTSGSK